MRWIRMSGFVPQSIILILFNPKLTDGPETTHLFDMLGPCPTFGYSMLLAMQKTVDTRSRK